jgi:succinate dehydrogenase / fumarate reductase cytochrome b subunit
MSNMTLLPRSSVAKKFLNAITGVGLGIFVIVHLLENLLLLTGNPDDFNRWAHFLESFGLLLRLIELGLAAFFLAHIWSALMVYWDKLKARPSGYSVYRSAGWTSRQTLSSQTMIYTGIILLAFVIWHVVTFRFGPYYTVTVDGVEMRDLHRLVVEVFRNPVNVALYVAVMVLLGLHLRHGFWSALQSLGAYHPRWTPLWYTGGAIVAALLAVGFIVIPVWVYLYL